MVASDEISITAKKAAAADGAAGNAWSIVYDVASTWKDDEKAAVDIDVRVNSRDSVVFVRFNSGKAKFGDLKAALEGNSSFASMFEVKLPANEAGTCGATFNELLDDLTGANSANEIFAAPNTTVRYLAR